MTTKMNGVSLVSICKSIKVNPKAGRAKLRRMNVPTKLLSGKDSWTFKSSARSWVVAQLKNDGRKKA